MPPSHTERGNIFIMVFGTLAMLGVLTMAAHNFMAGPMTSMNTVIRHSLAESQLNIAARLIILDSAETPGDCDGDGFIEPKEWTGSTHALGGGDMPMVGAAQKDPWGTPYRYCAWDMGGIKSHATTKPARDCHYLRRP